MAVETRIDADDDWFVGEDRVFRFLFREGNTDDIDTWPMELAFYSRRAKDTDPPLFTVAVTGIDGTPPVAVAQVTAEHTLDIGAGLYQFVLRRTDQGKRAVLSFGPAELRTAVNA